MAAVDEETVILTTKRRELFLFDSRLFRIVDENQNNLSVYYKCNTNPSVKCGGRLIRTAVGEIIQTVACLDTCHRLSDAKIAALRARKRLFDQVRSHPHRSIRFCYTDIRAELSQINLEAVIHLDSLSTLRASLQRWRRGVIPPRPENYNSIPTTELFPEIYTRNKFGQEPFLFLDRTYIPPEGNDGTAYRVLAFMSPRSATELVNANKVLIDGTFKVAAQPFSQMFTISTFRGGDPDRIQMIPRCWALLPFKSEHLYTYFFTELFSELSNRFNRPLNSIRWRELSSDYESGLLPFYRNYLIPTLQQARNDNDEQRLRINGCLFHFAQALHRKLVDLGMLQDYNDDTRPLKRLIKILIALHFLPVDEVIPVFHVIISTEIQAPYVGQDGKCNHPQLRTFLEYYWKTYLRNENMRRMVNCYQRQDHRTNNDVEGFHSKILHEFPVLNPDLWKFITTVQKIDYDYSLEEIQIDSGQGNTRKRRLRYRDIEARIERVKSEFIAQQRTALDYVKNISYLMME